MADNEFISRLKNQISTNYPSIDLRGPLSDIFIVPLGKELQNLNDNVSSLKLSLGSEFDESRSAEDYEMLGSTYGVIRDKGSKGTTNLKLSFLRAPSGLVVPSGTLAFTEDSKYIFTTLQEFNPLDYDPNKYLSPETGYYEYLIPISAVEVGTKYNIAANRISKLNITLPSGTLVSNPTPVIGGENEESLEKYWSKIKARSYIADISSRLGLTSKILDMSGSDIKGVYIAPNLNTKNSNVINIFIASDSRIKKCENFTSNNLRLPLKKRHYFEIESLKQGNTFIRNYKSEDDFVQIYQPIDSSKPIEVTFWKDELSESLESQLNEKNFGVFGKTFNVTHGHPLNIEVSLAITINSTILSESLKFQIRKTLFEYLNKVIFRESDLTLEELKSEVFSKFIGITQITVIKFQPKNKSSYLQGFNIACMAPNYIQIVDEDLKISFGG